jgi:hypothetical protein
MAAQLDDLVEHARARGLLAHDLIVDATESSGGAGAPELLRRLSGKPFKTTFGDVRLSDVTDAFSRRVKPAVRDWIRAAAAQGKPYTDPAPFKLQYFGAGQDGVMPPHDLRFSGRLVFIFFPDGGSQLDQMAAMVIDNDLGHSLGMATGGFSNTWEWREPVASPVTHAPLLGFMWTIGHTFRPNGQILEGNPARPKELVVMTAANYLGYFDDLVLRALDRLGHR